MGLKEVAKKQRGQGGNGGSLINKPIKVPKVKKPRGKAKVYVETKTGLKKVNKQPYGTQASTQAKYDKDAKTRAKARDQRRELAKDEARQAKARKNFNQIQKLATGASRSTTAAERAKSVAKAPGVLKPKLTHEYTAKEKAQQAKDFRDAAEPSAAKKAANAASKAAKKGALQAEKGVDYVGQKLSEGADSSSAKGAATGRVTTKKAKVKTDKEMIAVNTKIAKVSLTALDKANKPFDATGAAAQATLQGKSPKNIAKAAKTGWKQPIIYVKPKGNEKKGHFERKHANWKNIVGETLGAKKIPVIGGATTVILGETGNLVADPLNLGSGGTAGIAKKVVKEAVEGAAKGALKKAEKGVAKSSTERIIKTGVDKEGKETTRRVSRPTKAARKAARDAAKDADSKLNPHASTGETIKEKKPPRSGKGKGRSVTPERKAKPNPEWEKSAPERAAQVEARTRKHGASKQKRGKTYERVHGEEYLAGMERRLKKRGASAEEIEKIMKPRYEALDTEVAKAGKRELKRSPDAPAGKVRKPARKEQPLQRQEAHTGGELPGPRHGTVRIRTARAPVPAIKVSTAKVVNEGTKLRPKLKVKRLKDDKLVSVTRTAEGKKIPGIKTKVTTRRLDVPITSKTIQKVAAHNVVRNPAKGAAGLASGTSHAAALGRGIHELDRKASHTATPHGGNKSSKTIQDDAKAEIKGREADTARATKALHKIEKLAKRDPTYGSRHKATRRRYVTPEAGAKITDDYENDVVNDVTREMKKLSDQVGEAKMRASVEEMLQPGALKLRGKKGTAAKIKKAVSKRYDDSEEAAAKADTAVGTKEKAKAEPEARAKKATVRRDKATDDRAHEAVNLENEATLQTKNKQTTGAARRKEQHQRRQQQRAQGELDQTQGKAKIQDAKASGAREAQPGKAKVSRASAKVGTTKSKVSLTGRNVEARKTELADLRATPTREAAMRAAKKQEAEDAKMNAGDAIDVHDRKEMRDTIHSIWGGGKSDAARKDHMYLVEHHLDQASRMETRISTTDAKIAKIEEAIGKNEPTEKQANDLADLMEHRVEQVDLLKNNHAKAARSREILTEMDRKPAPRIAGSIPKAEKNARVSVKSGQVKKAKVTAASAKRQLTKAERAHKNLTKEFDRIQQIIERHEAKAGAHREKVPQLQENVKTTAKVRRTTTRQREKAEVRERRQARTTTSRERRLAVAKAREEESQRIITEAEAKIATLGRQQERERIKADVQREVGADIRELERQNVFEVRPDERVMIDGKLVTGPRAYAARMKQVAAQIKSQTEEYRQLIKTLDKAPRNTPAFTLKRNLEKALDQHENLADKIEAYALKLEKDSGEEAQNHLARYFEGAFDKTPWYRGGRDREVFDPEVASEKNKVTKKMELNFERLDQTRVKTKTARAERGTVKQVNKKRAKAGKDLYDPTQPFEAMRRSIAKDINKIYVERLFAKWHSSGRKYHGQDVNMDYNALIKYEPGVGLTRLNPVEAAAAVRKGEDIRVLSTPELSNLENVLRSQGWVPGNGFSRGWFNARSAMTHFWVTMWPGSWTRNVVGDTFNQILGGTGLAGILGGWNTTARATTRHLVESRVLPYSKEGLAAQPKRIQRGQAVAKWAAGPKVKKVKTVHLKKDGTQFTKKELETLRLADRLAVKKVKGRELSSRDELGIQKELDRISSREELAKLKAERTAGTTKRVDRRRKFAVKDKNSKTVYRTRNQLLTEATQRGVTGGFVGGELGGAFGRTGVVARAAAVREMGPRVGSFIEHRRANNLSGAIARTNKYHFDYQGLTREEKVLRDAAFPFWTWTARNARLQFGEMIRHPGAYNSMLRVLDMQAKEAGYDNVWDAIDDMNPKDVVLMPVALSKGVFFTVALPPAVLIQLLSGEKDGKITFDPRKLPENIYEMLVGLANPVIKTGVELVADRNFYFGGKLKKTLNEKSKEELNYLKPDAPTGITLFGHKLSPGVQDLPDPLKKLMGVEEYTDSSGAKNTVWAGRWNQALRGLGPEAQFAMMAGTNNSKSAILTKNEKSRNSLTGIRIIKTGDQKTKAGGNPGLQGDRRRLAAEKARLEAENAEQSHGSAMGKDGSSAAAKAYRRRLDRIDLLTTEIDNLDVKLGFKTYQTPQGEANEDMAKDLAPPSPYLDQAKELMKDREEMLGMGLPIPAEMTRQIDEALAKAKRGEGVPKPIVKTSRQAVKKKLPAKKPVASGGSGKVKARVIASSTPPPVSAAQGAPVVRAAKATTNTETTTTFKTKKSGKNGTYTASTFGGTAGDDNGVGYRGADLRAKKNWDTFAELDMGTALGGLPENSPIRVTYPNGKTQILYKRDIGAGGPGLNGHKRAVDIGHQAIKRAGYSPSSFLGNVKVELLQKGTLKTKTTLKDMPQGAKVKTAFGAAATQAVIDSVINRGGKIDTTALMSAMSEDAAALKRADTPALSNTGTPDKTSPIGKGGYKVAGGANRAGVPLTRAARSTAYTMGRYLGYAPTVTTGTNHNQMTTSGNVSDHWSGNGMDFGVGGDARSDKNVAKKGNAIAYAAFRTAGYSESEARAAARKGGAYTINYKGKRYQIIWKSLVGGNHYNHVHVGIAG
jgi:hypothetical protein